MTYSIAKMARFEDRYNPRTPKKRKSVQELAETNRQLLRIAQLE